MFDEAALLAFEADLDMSVYGVDAVVDQGVTNEPVATRLFWPEIVTEDVPVGAEFQRRDGRRLVVLTRVADRGDGEPMVLPIGTRITAPKPTGGDPVVWRVDGPDRIDHVYHYVTVVATDECPT